MTTVESLLVENADLHHRHRSLAEENEQLKNRLKSYENWTSQLEEAIKLLQLRKFAPKSEQLPSDNDQLFFDEFELVAKSAPPEDDSEQTDMIPVSAHEKKKPKRKPLPKDLPREVVVIDLPEAQKTCPHDGSQLRELGREVSERLDVIPMQMKIIETHRLTYVCPCCEKFNTAKVTAHLVPKGIPTAGTLAFIATAKFCDGLSLYHTSNIFKRSDVEIGRGTMAHWMVRTGEEVQPLINLLNDVAFESGYKQIDETPVQVLNEPGKKATSKSYMWVRTTPDSITPVVLFDYDPTRRAEVAKRLTEDFKGYLQCDGYSGYDVLEENPNIIRLGCLAHARRKFYEAVKTTKGASLAKHALKLINKIYKVEDDIRGKPPDEIYRIRQEKVVPLLDELRLWTLQSHPKVPPKSMSGKAFQYLKNEWTYLIRFTEDGRLQIDNNFVENKIRPFALGRKRWLFSQSVEGVKASANLYSLVETAKANGLDPYWYLRHVFEWLPMAECLADFEMLLPWNVKKTKSQALTTADALV